MITLQTRPIHVLCRADLWQASSLSSPCPSSSLESLLHSCSVLSESCLAGCCRRKQLPLAECSLSTSSLSQGSSRKGLVSAGLSRIGTGFVVASPIERLRENTELVCRNHADVATMPEAIKSFATNNSSMQFAVEGFVDSIDAALLAGKEVVEEEEDGASMPYVVETGTKACLQPLPPYTSSLPFSKQDAPSRASDYELRILEQEKLRRKKISEANKKKVPWNKGMKYKQGRPRNLAAVTNKNNIVLDDSVEIIAKEKKRRQRIAAANLGKSAWNKGKQHSEETRRRIKERTVEAMKDPKIREKLRAHGYTQSHETKSKISAGLVLMWEARKKLKQEQNNCEEEWKEYVADVARMGHGGEDEYDWSSCDTTLRDLKKGSRLNHKRRRMQGPRQPMTSTHRIKIANAIRAKWADLGYRSSMEASRQARLEKQGTGLVKGNRRLGTKKTIIKEKFHETLIDSRNLESDDNYEESNDDLVPNAEGIPGIGSEFLQSMQKVLPAYRNPLNDQMLENLKQIRAQRRSKETSRCNALERARILMAEAQMAASALEAQAATDESALPLLQEARQLLAEAKEAFKAVGLAADMFLAPSKGT